MNVYTYANAYKCHRNVRNKEMWLEGNFFSFIYVYSSGRKKI